MDKLIELDHQLFLWLNNLGNESWDWLWLLITDKWTAIPLYALLLFLIFKKFGWKPSLITVVFITLLITATDQLGNVFKDGFERLRPCRQEGVMEYARFVAVRCGSYGFFSAHAANSMGVAVFLGLLFRKVIPKMILWLVGWALLVAYSRVYLGVHYPGDIIVGMLIGALLGFVFFKLHDWVQLQIFKNS
ncbi:phosphatase PAP2 family protein [Salegentibacter mishustinae]|uniref:phosphatase PAP2 family protein n=1 Tax=Salegentibacter mishustinae TaxID=270918 RepID=UPI001CE049FF|nr:phosphatase PAP2 family protein [Salegentibacter mishustinae]UBZ05742.1 phosphatase PAP2 family protein [Salegentibacter mishustinae]